MIHFLGHFPLSFSLKNTVFRKLALFPSSGETIQPNQLVPLGKANLNPRQISVQITVHSNYIQNGVKSGHAGYPRLQNCCINVDGVILNT
jgi:hypothetical protein